MGQLAVKEEHAQLICPLSQAIPKDDLKILCREEVAVMLEKTGVKDDNREDVAVADGTMEEGGDKESSSAVR